MASGPDSGYYVTFIGLCDQLTEPAGIYQSMPELPEVETMRRGLEPMLGATVRHAARLPCCKKKILISPRIDHLNRRICGCQVVALERLGKRVVVRLNSGDSLVFEPRMTGIVLLNSPPTTKHLRFEVRFHGRKTLRLLFWDRRGLGRITLYTAQELLAYLHSSQLGIDACQVTLAELKKRRSHSRRPIKVALLDQTWIAGIGNLYASEILHRARINPRTRCNQLSPRHWKSLHDSLLCVLHEAIRYEGSTLKDGTYQKALRDPGRYQNHHRVYDRENQRCATCHKSQTIRIVQAQRSTFFCPICQPSHARDRSRSKFT